MNYDTGMARVSLGLATEWIEILSLMSIMIGQKSLGLATEWIEMMRRRVRPLSRGGLGLATEWIEIMEEKKMKTLSMSRSCDRVD